MSSNKPKAEGQRLERGFFTRPDVLAVSRELLGKYLVTEFEGQRTAGKIVEVEAYRGPDDKASHAYSGRYTERTKVMYAEGGHAYVYLCYGIHHLFNVVTATEGVPHAVLVRAIEPAENVALMLQRRGLERLSPRLAAGPGVLSQALGIKASHSGIDMLAAGSPIWLECRGEQVAETEIAAGPRIGIAYAAECAAWPWRFSLRGSSWVSKAK
jgi:DNA-3-methyladenine glycosylase